MDKFFRTLVAAGCVFVFAALVSPADAATAPTDGLRLWLKADTGVVATGGTVSQWLDQSGSGNHLVASGNPQLVPALTPAGQPAIRLDGVGDKLQRIHATNPLGGLPAGNADRTMVVVARYNGSSAWAGTAYGNGTFNETFGLTVKSPSGELVLQGWGGGNDLVSSTQGIGARWLVQSAVLSSGTATLYKDGEQIAQFGHTYNTTLSKLVIGEEIANAGFADMDVAAVLIYNRALSDTERAQLDEYLTTEYIYIDDSESPTTPAGVTATGVLPDRIDVRWSASTDNIGVSHYRILRDGGEVGTSTGTSFSDTGLDPLASYVYNVIAVDTSDNESTSSAPIQAVRRSVTLEWDANAEPDISGYRLHFGTSSRVYSYSVDVGNSTTAILSHLTAQTDYYCAVTAYNTGALESSYSNEVLVPSEEIGPAPPVITLIGPSTVNLSTGESYIEPGATAIDSQGGAVPVTVSGSVNTGAAGTYTLTYSAVDSLGNAATPVTRAVIVELAPFMGWLATHFTPEEQSNPEVGGFMGDPDEDNISNFLEYAFGRNPEGANTGELARSTIESVGGFSYAAITFQRPIAASDLQYVVQVSTDLETWNDGIVYEGGSATPSGETTEVLRTNDGTMETITVRANDPVGNPAAPGSFLRVRVVGN